MTLEEINALEIEDVSEILGQRLLVKSLPVTSENLATEFLLYKQELLDIETERLRIKDLRQRWKVMDEKESGYPAFRAIISDVPNPLKYFNDMIKDESKATEIEALMVQLETKDAELDLERQQAENDENDSIQELKDLKKDLIAAINATDWDKNIKKFLRRLAREEFKRLKK